MLAWNMSLTQNDATRKRRWLRKEGELSRNGSKGRRKPSSSSFDRQDHTSSFSSSNGILTRLIFLPHTAPLDTSKLGSRRLIATFRQIREDLIIVGEYLCDSVLGARVDDTTTTSSSNYTVPSSMSAVSNLLPFPPLVSDRKSPTSSAMRSKSLTLTPLVVVAFGKSR